MFFPFPISREVVQSIPSAWRRAPSPFRADLARLSGYLNNLGRSARGIGPEGVREVVAQLSDLGALQEADAVRRERLAAV